MKGLLIKDSYTLLAYGKRSFLMLLIFAVFPMISENYGFSSIVALVASLLPVTAMAISENCGWEKYENALPIPRWKSVLSKYLYSWFLLVASSVVVLAVNRIILFFRNGNPEGLFELFLGMIGVGLLFNAVSYPFLFHFGVEKGRLFYIVFIAAVSAIMASVLVISEKSATLASVDFVGILLPAAILISAVSVFLSIKLYQRREF